MKKILIIAVAIFATIGVNAKTKSKAMGVKRFDKVQVNVPAQVRVAQGEEYAIRFASADGLSVKNVKYAIEGDTLTISSEDIAMLEGRTDVLYITIITPSDAEMVKSRTMDMM